MSREGELGWLPVETRRIDTGWQHSAGQEEKHIGRHLHVKGGFPGLHCLPLLLQTNTCAIWENVALQKEGKKHPFVASQTRCFGMKAPRWESTLKECIRGSSATQFFCQKVSDGFFVPKFHLSYNERIVGFQHIASFGLVQLLPNIFSDCKHPKFHSWPWSWCEVLVYILQIMLFAQTGLQSKSPLELVYSVALLLGRQGLWVSLLLI